jgi:hypothetical protein
MAYKSANNRQDDTNAETSNLPASNLDKPAKRRKAKSRFNHKAAHFKGKRNIQYRKYNDSEEDIGEDGEGTEEDKEDIEEDEEGIEGDEEDIEEGEEDIGEDGEGTEDEEGIEGDEEDIEEQEEAERIREQERKHCAIFESVRIEMSKLSDDEVHQFYERFGC